MAEIQTEQKKTVELISPQEKALLEQLRLLGYGKIIIICEKGQPVRIEGGIKSIKL